MKSAENYPSPKWSAKCPDCGHKYMNIWENGKIHCGNCLTGGHFTARKYSFIKEEFFTNLKGE